MVLQYFFLTNTIQRLLESLQLRLYVILKINYHFWTTLFLLLIFLGETKTVLSAASSPMRTSFKNSKGCFTDCPNFHRIIIWTSPAHKRVINFPKYGCLWGMRIFAWRGWGGRNKGVTFEMVEIEEAQSFLWFSW